VQEIQVSGEEPKTISQPWETAQVSPTKAAQISADSLSEIPFRVKLLVRFSIKPVIRKRQPQRNQQEPAQRKKWRLPRVDSRLSFLKRRIRTAFQGEVK